MASELAGIDNDGYLFRKVEAVALSAKPAEIETEIRAQIERAISKGTRPSHIDTHMGTVYSRPDFTTVYLKLAEEYRIPAMAVEPWSCVTISGPKPRPSCGLPKLG